MTATRTSQYGTSLTSAEYQLWRQGAEAEAALVIEGMTTDGREFFEYAQELARRGDSPNQMVRNIAYVFTAGWTLRQRLTLAWALVLGR